ncbi:MAG: DUF2007 domain-containing protein [Actinomycetota bacterium]|nr:DUF2007 domain-containing protein [Actinomycetota bacterium]
MRQVQASQSLSEAHVVRGMLAAAGITASIRGEELTAGEGARSPVVELRPSVWVADADAEAAVGLLGDQGQDLMDTDEASSGEADGRAHDAMAALFVAAVRLQRDPWRGDLLDEVRLLATLVAESAAPFGVPASTWDEIAILSRSIVDARAAGGEDEVRDRATALRAFLRPYV